MRLTCNRMGGFFQKVRVINLTQGGESDGGTGEAGGGTGDAGVWDGWDCGKRRCGNGWREEREAGENCQQ